MAVMLSLLLCGWDSYGAELQLSPVSRSIVVLPQEFQRVTFSGDDKFSVDRLVQSCQPKVMPALPSAGRELVPYFSSPGECINDTLSQTNTDATRSAFVTTVASTCTHPVHDMSSTNLLCIRTGKGKSHSRSLVHPAEAPQGHQ